MSEICGVCAHRWWSRLLAVAVAVAIGSAPAGHVAAADGKAAKARPLPGLAPGQRVHVQTIAFNDPRRAPVKVIRGEGRGAPRPHAPEQVEIVSFGGDWVISSHYVRVQRVLP